MSRYNPGQSTGHSHGNGGCKGSDEPDGRKGSTAQKKRETITPTPASSDSHTECHHDFYSHNHSPHPATG